MAISESSVAARVLNLAFRFSSLGCRFLLIFLITRYLTVSDLGVFGLFNTTVAIGAIFIGLEFYQYNHREIAGQPAGERARRFANQLFLHAATYVVLLPVTAIVFAQGFLPFEYLLPFLIVVILEHLGLEQFRLLILLSRPLLANFVLFIRTALWVIVLFGAWFFDIGDSRGLSTVFDYWIAGASLALVLGGYYLHREGALIPSRLSIDLKLIATGLRVAAPFFLSALALRVMEFSDRYIIDAFLGSEALGVYTFFAGLAKVVMLGVSTIVTMIYYPRLLEFVHVDAERFEYFRKKMLNETLIYSAVFCVVIVAGTPVALEIVDKPQLFGQWALLGLLLAGQVAWCLSLVPHSVLYAFKRDRALLACSALVALASIVLNLALIPVLGLKGAALAGLASMSLLWALKSGLVRTLAR